MDKNFVIIEPLLTEKSTYLRKGLNKYCFKVDMRANKSEIVKAFRDIFNVEVLNCNIINMAGKRKRVRYKQGYKSRWKKAIVTVKAGQTLEFFAGM